MNKRNPDEVMNEVMEDILRAEKTWRETVQVGDLVDGTDNCFFLTCKKQYKTKGKLYKVKSLDMRPDDKSYCVICDSDVEGEIFWQGMGTVIIRKGVIVWNWMDAIQEKYKEEIAKQTL